MSCPLSLAYPPTIPVCSHILVVFIWYTWFCQIIISLLIVELAIFSQIFDSLRKYLVNVGCSWLWVTTNFFMCLRRQLGYWLAVCRLLSISTNRNQQFFCCVRHKGDQETRFFKFIGLKAHDTKLVASENSAVIRFMCGKAFQWALWKGHLSKMWPRYSYRKVVLF